MNHLAKVLRTLGRAGIVEALRGAGGGYRFRANAKRLTLLDVIQLFEDVGPNERSDEEPGAASPEGRVLRRVLDGDRRHREGDARVDLARHRGEADGGAPRRD